VVDNLFDCRMHVRDASGDSPISYQPDYLDPLGRSIKISFRKLFF
jgi:iron complex outermembrane receptor protein